MIKKIQIDDIIYTANTDFRIAIECNRIAEDKTIGSFERSLGIICTMFGPDALDNRNHYEKLLKWALKYLSCGKEVEKTNKKPDMDFIKDMNYIEASFMSDYHIDLENVEMDWQKFNKLLNGLSNSEIGNCCVLNRIRNIRNMDPKKIKDAKDRQELINLQKEFSLEKEEQKKATKEQRERANQLYQKLGLRRE